MKLLDWETDFIAHLSYLTTEEGGRIGPVFSGYRPQVKFPFSKSMTSGQQILLDKEMVFPGESVKVELALLAPITFKHQLSLGQEFEVLEGARLVGRGQILEILNTDLLKPNS